MSGKTIDDPIFIEDNGERSPTERLAEWYLDRIGEGGPAFGAFSQFEGATSKDIFITLTELTLWLLTNGSEGNLFLIESLDNVLVTCLKTALTHFGYILKIEKEEVPRYTSLVIIPARTPTHFAPHLIGVHQIIPGEIITDHLQLRDYRGRFKSSVTQETFHFHFDYIPDHA